MSKSKIFTVSDGNLVQMEQSAPENEDTMQQIVADHPEIISDDDEPLLLVQREQPISDNLNGSGRWSLDHLFVTTEGTPVLVELKRAVDTRLRREVVGQMLDYAANATTYWKSGSIAESFKQTAELNKQDPDQILAEFLDGDLDADRFWKRVDDSFVAGRIKLIFVADVIPKELAQIVEFLNDQMKAEVRAVELNWFEGSNIRAFTPRFIGETQRSKVGKSAKGIHSPKNVEQWLSENMEPFGKETVAASKNFCSISERSGAEVAVTNAQASIYVAFETDAGKTYPLSLTPSKNGMVHLNLAYLKHSPLFHSKITRTELYESLANIVGKLSTDNLNGYPAFSVSSLCDPEIAESFEAWLKEFAKKIGAFQSS